MHMIRRLVIWFWRAWPVLVMAALVYVHWRALACFPGEIEDVKSELSHSIASNQLALLKLSEQVEKATVGGFKQQAFGVMLVIYGAIAGVFA